MAKKKNPKRKTSFQDFVKSLKREDRPRVIDLKAERRYFLIVTEGEKTEPNYFRGLIDELPTRLVKVKIIGDGGDTISVVESAIKIREKRKQEILKPDFDEVWVVFDKDEFPDDKFNDAIQLASNNNIHSAYSNEAFELWYILHFQYLEAAMNREQYIEKLKKLLGGYKKNQTNIYELLQEHGNETQAIKWAKRLYNRLNIGNPAKEKPTTLVYKLVERLRRLKK